MCRNNVCKYQILRLFSHVFFALLGLLQFSMWLCMTALGSQAHSQRNDLFQLAEVLTWILNTGSTTFSPHSMIIQCRTVRIRFCIDQKALHVCLWCFVQPQDKVAQERGAWAIPMQSSPWVGAFPLSLEPVMTAHWIHTSNPYGSLLTVSIPKRNAEGRQKWHTVDCTLCLPLHWQKAPKAILLQGHAALPMRWAGMVFDDWYLC